MRAKTKAFGYVSLVHIQGWKEPPSLEEQIEKIKMWARDRNYELTEIITETDIAITGDSNESIDLWQRTGVKRLVTELHFAHNSIVVMYDVWRITKNVCDLNILAMNIRKNCGEKCRVDFIREGIDTGSLEKIAILSQIPMVKFFKREAEAQYAEWIEAHKTVEVVPYEPLYHQTFNSDLAPYMKGTQ